MTPPMLVYGDPRTVAGRFWPPTQGSFEPGVLRSALFRVLKLAGPVAVVATFVLGVHLLAPHLLSETLTLLAVFLAPLGIEASAPIGLQMGVPPLFLLAFMVLFDVALGLLLFLNLDYARSLPGVGKWVGKMETGALRLYEKRPWLRRAGFIGLFLLVFVPMAGTGGSTGVVVGKLTGMGAVKTLSALVVGTVLRCGLLVGAAAGLVSFL